MNQLKGNVKERFRKQAEAVLGKIKGIEGSSKGGYQRVKFCRIIKIMYIK